MSRQSTIPAARHLLVLAATRSEARVAARAARRLGLSDRLRVECIGIGPAHAERAARARLAESTPEAVLLVGVAGGLVPTLGVADVVVASAHRGLPGTPSADELAVDGVLARVLLDALRRAGLPASGGPFLTSPHALERPADKAAQEPDLVAVEMEGLGVAVAAAQGSVPFAALRTIMDPRELPLPDLALVRDAKGRGRVHLLPRALMRRPALAIEVLRTVIGVLRALRALERALVVSLPALADTLELASPGRAAHAPGKPRRIHP